MERIIPYGDEWTLCDGKKRNISLPHEYSVEVSASGGMDGAPAFAYTKKMLIPKAADEDVYLLFCGNTTVRSAEVKGMYLPYTVTDDGISFRLTEVLRYGIACPVVHTVFKKTDKGYFCGTGEVKLEWKKRSDK